MKVSSKYIKDEDGNPISPITSADSVYTENGIVISNLVPVVLFASDSENGTNEEITLKDSASNYSLMEVFFINGDVTNNRYNSSVKIYNPNNKQFCMSTALLNQTKSHIYLTATNSVIEDKVITPQWYGEYCIDTSTWTYTTNKMYIVIVMGYKEVI